MNSVEIICTSPDSMASF